MPGQAGPDAKNRGRFRGFFGSIYRTLIETFIAVKMGFPVRVADRRNRYAIGIRGDKPAAAEIDTNMCDRARIGSVRAFKEDKISCLWAVHIVRTVIKACCGHAGNAVPGFFVYIIDKTAAVKSGRARTTPNIRRAD